jgi:hypothetical protein
LLFWGKDRLGREDRLHMAFHPLPAKVGDFLHLFQNLVVVRLVGSESFPQIDAAYFYLGPGFHVGLLGFHHDLAQALNLRVRQAQVISDPIALEQSQQALNAEAISVFPQTVPRRPLVGPPTHIRQAEY